MQTITSRKLYGKLNSFMGTMRDGTARKRGEGQQVLIDYLQTTLAINEKKLAKATGKTRPELIDADRARLARVAHGLNADQLERNVEYEERWRNGIEPQNTRAKRKILAETFPFLVAN